MHNPIEAHDPDQALERAAALLAGAERVAVLTGAGISAESGVPTFRDAGGLWEGHRVEDVATPEAFRRDPTLVWRFYNLRRAALRTVRPNPGHHALAALEQRLGPERFALATQNIDGLHAAAGSRRVLELHGNLARVRCTGCGVVEDRGTEALADLPRCAQCGELLRPDVVWFHEALPEAVWEEAMVATHRCQCFLVVGTSAVVYPAAGLVDVARAGRARVIEINVRATEVTHKVDVALHGPSGQILPQLLERLPK
jgi:NAD-dependent deacetylase